MSVFVHPSRKCGFWEIRQSANLRNGSQFTVPHVHAIDARVVGLLLGRRPPTIARLIVAIHVWIAIQGHALRRSAHVSKEIAIIAQPEVTHTNSASTVDRILFVVLVIAARFCMHPCAVLLGVLVSFAVRSLCCPSAFVPVAPATARVRSRKAMCLYDSFIATLASALPEMVMSAFAIVGNHSEPAVLIADRDDDFSLHDRMIA